MTQIEKYVVTASTGSTSLNRAAYKVAIIGCGPKGLYGLERLLFELSTAQTETPIEIHIFNKSPFFGAGDIYRCDQPSYLLMNYPNGNINLWPEDTSQVVVERPLSFVEWLEDKGLATKGQVNLTREYSPRATVGEYLHDGYKQLTSQYLKNIKIFSYQGEIISIESKGNRYVLRFDTVEEPDQSIRDISEVLLTTGHPSPKEIYFGARQTINFVYPIDKNLREIMPGSKVAIKGMGLTFIDTVLGLTEGRGGRFEKTKNNSLKYLPSGLEPLRICPFSLSGLPMIPRKSPFGKRRRTLRFFNRNNLESIFTAPTDFERELWPLIFAEMKVAYYEVLFRQYGLRLGEISDLDTLQKKLRNFHCLFPEEKEFHWSDFTDPFAQQGDDNYHRLLTKYIMEITEEADKGIELSPIAAAADMWRSMSLLFNEYYRFGGLSALSQQVFHDKYAGHLNRVAYGPPIINMKKILALVESGIIDFYYAKNPSLDFSDDKSQWILSHSHDGSTKMTVSYLINARIPKNNLSRCNDFLYANLLAQGLIRPFINSDGMHSYRPGCLELSRLGQPIGKDGKVVQNITVSGTPTEGITYDNDTLSRSHNDFVSGWANRVKQNYIMANNK